MKTLIVDVMVESRAPEDGARCDLDKESRYTLVGMRKRTKIQQVSQGVAPFSHDNVTLIEFESAPFASAFPQLMPAQVSAFIDKEEKLKITEY